MREVAIVGAGELGGMVAHVLARRDVVPTVRLVDERGPVAIGKALDLMQAAPLERFATQISGSGDLYTVAGADLIVIADPAGESEWFADGGLTLVRRLGSFAREAVVLCAGGWLALEGRIEVGTVVAMVGGLGKLNDPWGDVVNWAREFSVVGVKYRLYADAANWLMGHRPPLAEPELATT